MRWRSRARPRPTRAIQQRNLFQAELALREMGTPSLFVLVDYLERSRATDTFGSLVSRSARSR